MLLLPLATNRLHGLKWSRNLLQTVLRMSIQLVLIGYYLEVLFRLNNLWLNLGWLLEMVAVANITTLKRSHLKLRHLFPE